MAECCPTNANRNDLIANKAAWLLWYVPAACSIRGFKICAQCIFPPSGRGLQKVCRTLALLDSEIDLLGGRSAGRCNMKRISRAVSTC